MVSFDVQPILPGRERPERGRDTTASFFLGEKRSNCLYRALTAPSLSFRVIFFVCHGFICHLLKKSFNSWDTFPAWIIDLGLAVHFREESVGRACSLPGCEATTWEVEGALAEWTGTKFIQFLHLVITFVAFRGSLQMYFSSQYGGYFLYTHRVFS